MSRTAIIFREEALRHDTGPFHPESPARLEAILESFEKYNIDPPILDIEPAKREDLLRIHTAHHVDTIEKTCKGNLEYPDPDTVMGEASWESALLAVGGAISACKAVLEGTYDCVFEIMRPPGHHAEPNRAMGFCLFNNVAIAARWLTDVAGLKRVAIFDFDVHHGNGTQKAFYDDDRVYYVSIHQFPHYPGTGFPEERGKNNTNLNVQMMPGVPEELWHSAMENLILPELKRFAPEFLIISAGFDAHRKDPLGSQNLEEEDFAKLTRAIKGIAGGKVVSVLEGGYNLEALGESCVAHYLALKEDS
ncbi:MAG TPA: histone deacetylase [Candidatus Hydrogenedens sp.]|nr:histone deacetylase [Candidatus Hydrogenedens sp.]HOL19744.1 histone deacetylase [Candidatus Hydrogenedens sp.]HPP59016.1 histone deacetylase [Candidatus Hydrogenedens sp.]